MDKEKHIEIILNAAGMENQNSTARVVMNLGDDVRYCTENGKRIEPCPTDDETKNYVKVTLNLNHEKPD